MPKTYIENIENQGGTINVHNSQINLPPHKVPKKLTPQTGLANEIDFVGRKEELQKVDELLNQNSMLLLLNGIGGIGKSTLASYYLNQKKNNFDYYGFVQVNEDIKLSLVSAFGTSLDLKSEKIDDLFAEIMNKLQNLEGKKLLIIDDVKEMDSQLDEMNTLMTLKNSGFQILFTSRETKEYIPQYFLDIMSVEDARELFLKHYPTDEMDKVDKILGYLDYHTLFIEITAKTLKKRKNTLSLDIAIEKFDNGEFTAVKRNKSESFNKFLKNFSYNSVMLTQKKNLLFLKRLSVLPSIEISFEDLYKFLVCEDKEKLEDFLIELVDNGWLIESDGGYKFHQILKEFMCDNYLPIISEIETILDNYNKDAKSVIPLTEKQVELLFFQSLLYVLNKIGFNNTKIMLFCIRYSNIYIDLNFSKKRIILLEKFLPFINQLEKIEIFHFNLALSRTYFSDGNMEKAKTLVYESLNSLKPNLEIIDKSSVIFNFNYSGEIDSSVVAFDEIIEHYQLLGKIYHILGQKNNIYEKTEYKKALNYYKLAFDYYNFMPIMINKFKYSIKFSLNKANLILDIADLTLDMANISPFMTLEENDYLQYSGKCYLEALSIYEEYCDLDSTKIALVYSHIGIFYQKIGSFNESIAYLIKANEIYKNKLGELHEFTGRSYNNLATIYFYLMNATLAYKYMLKSVQSLRNYLPKDSYNLNLAETLLEDYRRAVLMTEKTDSFEPFSILLNRHLNPKSIFEIDMFSSKFKFKSLMKLIFKKINNLIK